MQGDQFATELGECFEQGKAGGQGQTREVYLQELGVATPIAGTVEDCVDVVEDVFGGEAGGKTVSIDAHDVKSLAKVL
jgi:hypothetical protein